MKLLIWDFDSTLAYREGRWTGSLLSILDEQIPDHTITGDMLRMHLQTGFPWHTPERGHTPFIDAATWWRDVLPVFQRAYEACGIAAPEAARCASYVPQRYCCASYWRVFPDVQLTLHRLRACGWTHIILSNHVPELPLLVEQLALHQEITTIFTSAVIGYEKPHPQAFAAVRAAHPNVTHMWMIGDNYRADIQGAEAVHIPGILVRTEHPAARYHCQTLAQLEAIIAPGDA